MVLLDSDVELIQEGNMEAAVVVAAAVIAVEACLAAGDNSWHCICCG
jgi:hypothetical protein